VVKFWLSAVVFGQADKRLFRTLPTQSMMTLLNGSSKPGIGFNGAGGIFWFGFLTT